METRIALVHSETADRVVKVLSEMFAYNFIVKNSSISKDYKVIYTTSEKKISRAKYEEMNNFAHGASAAFLSGL